MADQAAHHRQSRAGGVAQGRVGLRPADCARGAWRDLRLEALRGCVRVWRFDLARVTVAISLALPARELTPNPYAWNPGVCAWTRLQRGSGIATTASSLSRGKSRYRYSLSMWTLPRNELS